jgi:MOSC domain-containing protein YiiM
VAKLLKIWTKPGKKQQMRSHESIECIVGKGLEGCAGGKSKHRQVTILSLAAWNEAQEETGQQLDPASRRANLLVDQIDFEDSKGKILTIGDLEIEITGETKPCAYMDELHEGLRDAMKPHWRGGATGKILNSCRITIGDSATIQNKART